MAYYLCNKIMKFPETILRCQFFVEFDCKYVLRVNDDCLRRKIWDELAMRLDGEKKQRIS